MIKTFKHKGLKKFFEKGSKAGIQPEHEEKIRLILGELETAGNIKDLDSPGLKLHQLKGDKKDTYAISVSGNWRITFRFKDGDIFDVNYEDYH